MKALYPIAAIVVIIYCYGGQNAVQDAYDSAQHAALIITCIAAGLAVVGFCIFAFYKLAKHMWSEMQWKSQQPTFEEWNAQQIAQQIAQRKLDSVADLLAALKQSMERKAAR